MLDEEVEHVLFNIWLVMMLLLINFLSYLRVKITHIEELLLCITELYGQFAAYFREFLLYCELLLIRH
jgi:hypothetical protein